jgi:hypothetical protein
MVEPFVKQVQLRPAALDEPRGAGIRGSCR